MRCMRKIDQNEVEKFSVIKLISFEAFQEQDHPRDSDGKFVKKGSSKLPKETVDKIIDKIKNTPDWKSRDGYDVSDKVETSHFLTPDGELIGNYNHQTMVSELAPMIDGFELTGKTGGGSIKEKDGTWTKLPYKPSANWNDITNFLAHTGFVRATNEGIGERGFGHSVNLTVNGILTNSQIRAIQRMEQTSSAGTTLVFDIMGDETQSGHGTFRDFMRAYRKNYGTEVFREEDRERIPAGQPNAGQWVASGGSSQSVTVRDRVINRYVEKKKTRIKKLEDVIQEQQEKIDDPDYVGDDEFSTKDYLQYSIKKKKEKITQLKDELVGDIKNAKERKELYDGLNLIEISGIGKNTHNVGSRGFKNGTTKSLIKDWKLELGAGGWLKKNEPTSYGDHGDKLVRVKEWEDRFKGKTLINSNVKPSVDNYGKAKELEDEIMFFWNDVMTDDQREGIDVLKIYYSKNPQYKTRLDGSKERTLGSHGSRKKMEMDGEDALLAPSVLTMNISPDDTLDDVLNTLIHEVSHSQWANNVKNDWDKTNKFTEKILELGREGAITDYARSYFDDLDEVKKENEGKWEEEKDRLINHHNYGKADNQTEEEYQSWVNQNILNDVVRRKRKAEEDIRENIAKVERLIANETHSEYFAMVSAPTDKEYHTVDTVKLQEMSKLIKENLYG